MRIRMPRYSLSKRMPLMFQIDETSRGPHPNYFTRALYLKCHLYWHDNVWHQQKRKIMVYRHIVLTCNNILEQHVTHFQSLTVTLSTFIQHASVRLGINIRCSSVSFVRLVFIFHFHFHFISFSLLAQKMDDQNS